VNRLSQSLVEASGWACPPSAKPNDYFRTPKEKHMKSKTNLTAGAYPLVDLIG